MIFLLFCCLVVSLFVKLDCTLSINKTTKQQNDKTTRQPNNSSQRYSHYSHHNVISDRNERE